MKRALSSDESDEGKKKPKPDCISRSDGTPCKHTEIQEYPYWEPYISPAPQLCKECNKKLWMQAPKVPPKDLIMVTEVPTKVPPDEKPDCLMRHGVPYERPPSPELEYKKQYDSPAPKWCDECGHPIVVERTRTDNDYGEGY
jgi:hypothetical protein